MNQDWADKHAEEAMDYSSNMLPDLHIPQDEEENTPQQQKFLDSISDKGPFNVTMTGIDINLRPADITNCLKEWNIIVSKVEASPDGFILKFPTHADCCRVKNALDKTIQGRVPKYKFLSDSIGYARSQQRKNINYGGDRFSRINSSKSFNQANRDRDNRQPQRQREKRQYPAGGDRSDRQVKMFNTPVGGSIREKQINGESQIIRQPLQKRWGGNRSNDSSPNNRQRRTTPRQNSNLRRVVDKRDNRSREERRGGDRWSSNRGRDRDNRYNESSQWDKPDRRGATSDNWRPKNMIRSNSSRTRPNREFKRQPQILQKSKYEEDEKPRGNPFAALTQD